MRKLYTIIIALMMVMPFVKADAQGWPANYEGVMLQGFAWDSYGKTKEKYMSYVEDNWTKYKPDPTSADVPDSKWTTLTGMADELSQYFDLIWVPNSGKSASGNWSMGYDPIYWFTNHNGAFGTEKQIRDMIKTFADKGVGIIEDVVVNHRSGVSKWWDFPAEQWNGTTYQLTTGSICKNDEMWYSSDSGATSCPSSYKGGDDTGEGFDGSRDLDHTNTNVQNNIKAYCKFLLEDMGYAGFRYDMVKGYGPQYTKIYNEYSNPTFSVGEFFDSNYDNVKWWIDGTGKKSAAFDFPCKYQINKALGGGEQLTELVWKANYTTDQPAGMIHHEYQQYAVTFVDNHDTYRDGSRFTGDVLMANAFILSSPGTPCVFWPHYTTYKSAIQKMIQARKAAGVHNQSTVVVEKSTNNCYMAVVQGSKGKLGVKIGSTMDSPAGFTDSEIITSGNGYCIWVKKDGSSTGGNTGGNTNTGKLYMIGNSSVTGQWSPNVGLTMTSSNGKFVANNVTLEAASTTDNYAYFSFTDYLSSNSGDAGWADLNNGSHKRYGSAGSVDAVVTVGSYKMGSANGDIKALKITPGTYNFSVDPSSWTVTISTGNGDNQGGGNQGGGNTGGGNSATELYILGNLEGHSWTPADSPKLNGTGTVFEGTFTLVPAAEDNPTSYFSFTTALGKASGDIKDEWDSLNEVADRYGAFDEDQAALIGTNTLTAYPCNVTASGCLSFKIDPGMYTFRVDLSKMTVTIAQGSRIPDDTDGVSEIESDEPVEPIYFNLQGVKVNNPSKGIFIKVTGNKREKVVIR